MLSAVKNIPETFSGHVRIFTDSLARLEALQGDIEHQSTHLQHLAKAINKLSCKCRISISWVPSHCGTLENEKVDELAKSGLNLPMAEQVKVPHDLLDVTAALKVKQVSLRLLPEDDESQKNSREARLTEATLAQWFTGHTPKLHPVASYMNKKVLRCDCNSGQGLNIVNIVDIP